MKKINYGVVHAIVDCDDCDWKSSNYKNAQACAAIHAKVHHHKVHVEIGLAFIYDGRITEGDSK